MRALIALIVVVYIVGIGVVLSPTIRDKWTGSSGIRFHHKHDAGTPDRAMAWPATVISEAYPNEVQWACRKRPLAAGPNIGA